MLHRNGQVVYRGNVKLADTGFRALGGTSRRYLDLSTNEEISRREYYQRSGRPSPEQIKEQRQELPGYKTPMATYSSIVNDYRNTKSRELGLAPRDIRVRGDFSTAKELTSIVQMLKSKDKSPLGDKAAALVSIGRREEDWDFAVGETPSKE